MTTSPDAALRDRARRAYERGRWRHAFAMAALAAALLALSTPLAVDLGAHVAVGLALTGASALLVHRGGPAGSGVLPGLWAGIGPLVLPAVMYRATCGSGTCPPSCLAACLAGGAFAGAFLGLRARQRSEGRVPFLLAAGGVASAVGALGSCLAGGLGVAGMVAALALVAMPVAWLRPAHA